MIPGEESTEIANALSEAVNACAAIGSPEAWLSLLGTMTEDEARAMVSQELDRFLAVAPLVDLPSVQGPKDEIHQAEAVAVKLRRLSDTWATGDPPPAVVALARELLAVFGIHS